MLASESFLMRLARSTGQERLAWSLRRLHCPVGPQALVLEVGSGGNPYPRANVLLDAYEATRERHWVPLVADRPTVLGYVENLPFQDQAFDFVIASHVLEHSTHPELFLGELQRVARAGYIEVPDAFMERVNPYRDHRLEITVRDARLVIRKKPGWRSDSELVELYEHRAKPLVAGRLIPAHPFDFHVRHYWESSIAFEVLNPDTDASWQPPAGGVADGPAGGWRRAFQGILRSLLSQRSRNRRINLQSLLRCPSCRNGSILQQKLQCQACGTSYESRHGIPLLYPREPV